MQRISAKEAHPATGGPKLPHDETRDRGLTGTVIAHEGADLTRAHRKVRTSQHLFASIGEVDALERDGRDAGWGHVGCGHVCDRRAGHGCVGSLRGANGH